MPRPTRGHVVERPWADGKTVSYGAKLRAYGRYEKVTFGTNKQGWNRTRAELETERIIQQIERGTWVPPRLEPPEDRLGQAMSALGVQVDESFRVFAKRWWRSKQLGLDEDTINDYEWRLGYLRAVLRALPARRDLPAARRPLPRRAPRAGRDDPQRAGTRTNREGTASADGDRHRQARPELRAAAPAALEHVDQRDDQPPRADPPAGDGLRADRPQPRARRWPLRPLPSSQRGRSARSWRWTSSTPCSTPPASSRPRRAETSKALAAARWSRPSAWPDCGSAN